MANHTAGAGPDSVAEIPPHGALTARDGADKDDRAPVGSAWDVEIEASIKQLELVREFREAGRTWSEADAQGRVTRRV